jgi:uncharacterized FAD-dependent dehydrogenase
MLGAATGLWNRILPHSRHRGIPLYHSRAIQLLKASLDGTYSRLNSQEDPLPFFRISQIKMPLGHDAAELERRILKLLRTGKDELEGYSIEKKSFDARDRNDIRIVYAVVANLRREPSRGFPESVASRVPERGSYVFPAARNSALPRPIVVGSGPAGLFCALVLAENGYRPLLLERGDGIDARNAKVSAFFDSGSLDPESNIQFGEGGAGTYSDGKLNTTVTDQSFRNAKVLEEFVEAGAPPEIRYLNKPHIGTDYLVRVVKALRKKIEAEGGEVRFRSRVSSLLVAGGRIRGVVLGGSERIEAEAVVLAIGHSARDTFLELSGSGIAMERKAFAIGLRIEHPQEMISRRQFGESWRDPALPVADYKLTHRSANGRGVYTFCMCPGGYVVNSSSEPGMVACNGMSDYGRDSANANSAIVATVGPSDFGEGGELSGMDYQRKWERLAFEAGGGDFRLPLQTLGDFLAARPSTALGAVLPSIRGRYSLADLNACLPDYVAASIKEGILAFDRSIPGFARPDALLSGVETRTSSPVRILRGEDFQSAVRGLYPCGEGSGYSGGIMSSAIDGIKVAEAIALA